MFGTMFTSYSGTVTNSLGLQVTSNNLANISTIGFKRSSANFGEIMTSVARGQSGNGNLMQIGLGARTSEIKQHFTQGPLQETGQSTDLALLGDGFFVTSRNGVAEYTRAGNFRFKTVEGPNDTKIGQLIGANGGFVQGWTTRGEDGRILTDGAMGQITVDYSQPSPPRPTSTIRLATNLAGNAQEGALYSTTLGVWDSLGAEHELDLNFVKTANPGEWSYTITSGTGITVEGGTGTLQFDENGQLASLDGISVDSPDIDNKTLTLTGLPGGAENLSFNWEMINRDNTERPVPLMTNFSNYSSTGTLYQNGFGSGNLQKIDFRQDGTMLGFYTNGDTVELAKVGVAAFSNPNGLLQTNGSFFRQTATTGEPVLRDEQTVSILGNSVEMANVDIAEELTSLMVYQRGFQGNSKVITTTDQLLQEVLGLKR